MRAVDGLERSASIRSHCRRSKGQKIARNAPIPGRGATQLLVLRYGIGDKSNRPQGMTEDTLKQLIGSLGLP